MASLFFFPFCLFVPQKMTSVAELTRLFEFEVVLTQPRWSFSGGLTGKKQRRKEKPYFFFKTRPLELSASRRCSRFKNFNLSIPKNTKTPSHKLNMLKHILRCVLKLQT
jgi:hypothetical protein